MVFNSHAVTDERSDEDAEPRIFPESQAVRGMKKKDYASFHSPLSSATVTGPSLGRSSQRPSTLTRP